MEGLNELNRALRALGKDVQGELKKAHKDVADTVTEDAQGRAYGLGSTAALVAPGLASFGGTTSAGVRLGGHPAAMGAEFGGRGRPTTQQFQPWRGSGSGAGYFLFPAIRANADRITETYEGMVDDLLRKHDLA